jgi:hypothetical protein
MKLTSFAYNLYDGTFDKKKVFNDDYDEYSNDKDADELKDKKKKEGGRGGVQKANNSSSISSSSSTYIQRVYADRRKYAVQEMPSALEFFG